MTEPFKLDGRLALCASFVREGARVADIGTDHAYLPVWLCKTGVIKEALACDIGQEPLQNGIKTVYKYGAQGSVRTRLCNGLSGVKSDEADDIVIAGMGGETIAQIIDGWEFSKAPGKRFILQPMTRCRELIEFLCLNGFEILRQECCRERGKVYTVMLVSFTGRALEPPEIFTYLGRLSPNEKPLDREFAQRQLRDLENKSKGNEAYKKICAAIKKELCYENS